MTSYYSALYKTALRWLFWQLVNCALTLVVGVYYMYANYVL